MGDNHGYATVFFECEYCLKEITGGVPGLKLHLEAEHKETGAHEEVSSEFKAGMWKMVPLLQENELGECDEVASSNCGKRKRNEGVVEGTSTKIIFKKNLKEEACEAIASFFYNNAIPFRVAMSDEFKKMIKLVARHGKGFEPPSCDEIGDKYLKQQVDSYWEIGKDVCRDYRSDLCNLH